MKAYRVAWTIVWAALCTAGVGALFVHSSATLLFVFLSFAIVGSSLTPAVAGGLWDRPTRERIGLLVTGAVASGTVAGALAGLGVVLGPGVVPLVLLGLASSPHAVNLYRRCVCSAPSPPVKPPDTPVPSLPCTPHERAPVPPREDLCQFTDEQLCQGWRASYLALQLNFSSDATLETVEQRQRYLDEFERRNASGLAAWLASGARAAGNPLPYLGARRADRHAIDWDELTRGQDR